MEIKELKWERRAVWDVVSDDEESKIFRFADEYKKFLSQNKTEREVVKNFVDTLKSHGFKDISEAEGSEKVFVVNRGKALAAVVFGEKPVSQGVRIIASHIDVPRIDMKPVPLYEEVGIAMMDTHYYGGIKKFQWVARPLAIHGVVVKEDGRTVEIVFGESPDEPVLTIEDLLPHLARKAQYGKKLEEAIPGEKLNLIVGSMPLPDREMKDRVKLAVLKLLHDKYGIAEEDFISAELEIVPAGPAKDVGFDSSMIGGYGQDDRICAYTSLRALLDVQRPKWTVIALFFDKEEIGSDGNTGAQSRFIESVIAKLIEYKGEGDYFRVIESLNRSEAISADVNAALDPDWKEVHEIKNAAKLGYGLPITKYTGRGGKYTANDAHAEFVAKIRRIFNRAGVVWQPAELGKVDEGGGGTVAKYLAKHGMDVIDSGPALLSMHSPFEIASKADLWMAYKGYKAFFEAE